MKYILLNFFTCLISFAFQSEIHKNQSYELNNNNNYNNQIRYKTEELFTSNFTINPNNEYYYEFLLESMNFPPYDIFPAIYKVNINSLKDKQYYFAKVHFSDAVKKIFSLKKI